MVQVALGTGILDWTTKAPVISQVLPARKDRGVLFFLDQVGTPVQTANQYVAVVARFTTSYGMYETPLEAKWFPGAVGLMFVVAIPDADYIQDVDVQIILLPKEFKPGSRSNDTISFGLSYEDDFLRVLAVPIA